MIKMALVTLAAMAIGWIFIPGLPGGTVHAATDTLNIKYGSGSSDSISYSADTTTGEIISSADLEGLTVTYRNGFVLNMENYQGVSIQGFNMTNGDITINLSGDNVLTGTNQSRALLYVQKSNGSLGSFIINAEEGATLTINNTRTYTSTANDNSAITASLLRINGGDIRVNQTANLSSSTAVAYGIYCSGRVEINNDAGLHVNASLAEGSEGTKCSGILASYGGVYYASSGDFTSVAPENGLYNSPLYIAGTGNAYFEGRNKASDHSTLGYKNYGGTVTRSASDYTIYGDKAKPALKMIYKAQETKEPPITDDVEAIDLAVPESGAVPRTLINEEKYMGLVSYSVNGAAVSPDVFAEETVYTANISIVPKAGYSLEGLTASDFMLDGASDLTFDAATGLLSGTYPETERTTLTLINTELPVPVLKYQDQTLGKFAFETDEYTADIDWYMNGEKVTRENSVLIGPNTVMSAYVTLSLKEGYTTIGVPENGYTVAGCPGAQVTNAADAGSGIYIVFPATARGCVISFSGDNYGLQESAGVSGGKTLPEGISFDAENYVVTIDGYTGEYIEIYDTSAGSAPKIYFKGDNSLSGGLFNFRDYGSMICGIYCSNSALDIDAKEGATLSVHIGSEASPVTTDAIGIYNAGTDGAIKIRGGDIDIEIHQSGNGSTSEGLERKTCPAAAISGTDCTISEDADVTVNISANSTYPVAGYIPNGKKNAADIAFTVDTDKAFRATVTNKTGAAYIYDEKYYVDLVPWHEEGQIQFDENRYLETIAPGGKYSLRAIHSVTYADSENGFVTGQPEEGTFVYEDTVTVDPSKFAAAEGYYPAGFALYTAGGTYISDITNEQFTGPGYDVVVKGIFLKRTPLSEIADGPSLQKTSYVYDMTEKTPAVTFPNLAENEDYTVAYADHLNAGTATVTLTGIGKYIGTLELPFAITKASAEEVELSVGENTFTYDGAEHSPSVKMTYKGVDVTDNFDLGDLTPLQNVGTKTATVPAKDDANFEGCFDIEYSVIPAELTVCINDIVLMYRDPIPIEFQTEITGFVNEDDESVLSGEAVLWFDIPDGNPAGNYEINGSGLSAENYVINYTGMLTILPLDLSDMSASLAYETATYTGKALEPAVEIAGLASEDYTVTYKNHINAGTATVTIKGIGNYKGTIEKNFTIDQKSIEGMKVTLSFTSVSYSGKELKPTATISGLKSGTDFTVGYANNKKVGTATVTITGKGNHTGQIKSRFKIIPAKPAILKLTSGKKKLTVKMKTKPAAKGAVSYKIAYRAKGASKWKYKTTKKQSLTLTKLKKGKKYQVKVCSVNGKSFSAYTAAKTSNKVK